MNPTAPTPSPSPSTPPNAQQRTPYTLIQTVTNAAQIPSMNKKLGEHGDELRRQKTILNWILGLTVGISIVCFIAFTTFIIDAWNNKAVAVEENTKAIDSLKVENKDLKDQLLNQRMDFLQREYDSMQVNRVASSSGKSN